MKISVAHFSAPIGARVFKFCVNDELYCVTKNSHILHISPFICSFFFFPMKISVPDFSAPIVASVFKFCVHLQVG